MESNKQNADELLLDWHLDRLNDEDRSRVDQELRSDPKLRAKSERLGQILQPLDNWRVAPASQNLADKVLAHVARSADVAGVPPPPPTEDESGLVRFPFTSLRDLVAVAACILLLVGVFIPGVSTVRGRAQRTACASNLSSIFRGTSTYQQAFASSLPFAGNLPGASWLPTGASGRPYASNSRHLYLLVKLGYVPTPDDFVCPAAETAVPMRVDDPRAFDDFPSTCNVSYAALNMAGPGPNLKPTMPIAYISDTNPLFVGARFNDLVDPDRTNSPVHGGKGQNVLTLDGSAKWMTKPVYGPNHDNLWLIDNIRHYTGIEIPTRKDDVQLVPGFPATDPEVCRTLQQ